MNRTIFIGILFCFIFCFSSCIFYSDLVSYRHKQDVCIDFEDKTENRIITQYQNSIPLFEGGIYGNDEKFSLKKQKDTSPTKLSYKFTIRNAHLIEPSIFTVNNFFFINKQGDTIPCILKCFSPFSLRNNDSINLLKNYADFPVIINLKDTAIKWESLDVIAECDELYHKTKRVYVCFDANINNQIIRKKIKYKRKLCIERLL